MGEGVGESERERRSCDSSRPLSWETRGEQRIANSFFKSLKFVSIPAASEASGKLRWSQVCAIPFHRGWWIAVEMSRTDKCHSEATHAQFYLFWAARSISFAADENIHRGICGTDRDGKENCFPQPARSLSSLPPRHPPIGFGLNELRLESVLTKSHPQGCCRRCFHYSDERTSRARSASHKLRLNGNLISWGYGSRSSVRKK